MAGSQNTQLPDGFLDIFSVARLPSLHPGAFVERGGKAIRPTEEQGYFCFGQYKKGYPTIPLQALFSILIDNNTSDDRNILILDVYDHHIDRVIGKRVITRKDFPKLNEFCLFSFDFTPPSSEANMEFRIYYMGHAYILANKIAVIDPAKVSITKAAEIPDTESVTEPDVVVKPDIGTEESELPDPWNTKNIGNGSGRIQHYENARYEAEKKVLQIYHIDVQVESTGSQDPTNDFYYTYLTWPESSRNGKVVAKFSHREGAVGVMFRETLAPDSKFVMVEKNRLIFRKKRGSGVESIELSEKASARGLKLVRKGEGSSQKYIGACSVRSDDDFQVIGQASLEMPQKVYVGLAAGRSKATVSIGVEYKDKSKNV